MQGRTLRDLAADFLRQGLGMAAPRQATTPPPSSAIEIGSDGLPVIRGRTDAPARRMSAEALIESNRSCKPRRTCAMAGCLFDTNAWLASVFEQHPFHGIARQALQQATPAEPAVFCRATQQSFLRLASTSALQRTYGVQTLTNRDALMALDTLQALPQVCWRDEPPVWLSYGGVFPHP